MKNDKETSNNIIHSLRTAFIAAIINFIIPVFFGYLNLPNGHIGMGEYLNIKGTNYIAIDISNYTNKPIDNLRITLPEKTKVNEISSLEPVIIKRIDYATPNPSNLEKYEISGIEAHRRNLLLIPSQDNAEKVIKILNAQELNLEVTTSDLAAVESPYKKLILSSILNSLIFSIIVLSALLYFSAKIDQKYASFNKRMDGAEKKANEQIDKNNKLVETLTKDTNDLRDRARSAENRLNRLKILLLTRISDYRKELDFWRNLVAKLLYQAGGKSDDINVIKDTVTETLKTYGVKAQVEDTRALLTISEMMISEDKK